jgi:hypothetical protein
MTLATTNPSMHQTNGWSLLSCRPTSPPPTPQSASWPCACSCHQGRGKHGIQLVLAQFALHTPLLSVGTAYMVLELSTSEGLVVTTYMLS